MQQQPTLRIFTMADESYCLSARKGEDKVVLAPANSGDENQHWIKDMRYSKEVKDAAGLSGFALVNKATGQAIKHSTGNKQPVRLAPYDPDIIDNSVMWTEGNDMDEGFRPIRMLNTCLNFHALGDGGKVYDGTTIVTWEWVNEKHQKWKIVPWYASPQSVPCCCQSDALSREPTLRILTKADESYSLSIRDGNTILAPSNPGDELQHWIKDTRYSKAATDASGSPSFALVNRATGQAITHSTGNKQPLRLVRYQPEYMDKSVLWTVSGDMGEGFRSIRTVAEINLTFDAFHIFGDYKVSDGTKVVLWDLNEGNNQKWKIINWNVFPPRKNITSAPCCCPRGTLTLTQEPTVRIFTKAEGNYSLSIRGGNVILAPSNPRDELQHWIKDMRYSTIVEDENGFQSFALVNKAMGVAIRHSFGASQPLRLVPYTPDFDDSILWTASNNTGEGFRCIRMVNNIRLNFDAYNGNDRGKVSDGAVVGLSEWREGNNQMWKIIPHKSK